MQAGIDPVPILEYLLKSGSNSTRSLILDINTLVEVIEQKPLTEDNPPSGQNTEQRPLTEDSDNSTPLPVVCISRNKEGLCSGWLLL